MLLSALLIPLLIAVICVEGGYILSGKDAHRTRLPKLRLDKLNGTKYDIAVFGMLALGQFLFYLLSGVLLGRFAARSDGRLPAMVMITVGLCASGAVFLRLWSGKAVLRKFAAHCAVLSVVLLLMEVLIFNAKSLTTDYREYVLTADNIQIETTDLAAFSEQGGIAISGNAQIILHDLPDNTRVIAMDTAQAENLRAFRVQLKMRDDNFAEYYQTAADKLVGGHGYPCEFTLAPYGEIRSLQLQFMDVTQTVQLVSVTASNCIPFRFSSIRYFALFTALALFFAVKDFGFSKITYDRTNRRHRIAVIAMTAACTASALFFYVPDQELIGYPLPNGAGHADPYVQTFDAFQNGRVWIDITPDENLEMLENVYDADVRGKSGFGVAWDRAYFEGKYYSYFGVTPVFVLYYPVYFLTGKLPTLTMTNGSFGTLTILFLCLAILAAVRLFVPRANLLLLLLTMAAATCLSGAYYCFQYPNMYDAVVASGLCSLYLTIWLGLRACFTERRAAKLRLLAGCGIALGLCAGSRPSMAIGALVLTPLFLGILLNKQEKLPFRIGQAAAFLTPVIAAGAALMYYNWLRFGAPLDFGANYQLTVSDVHANHLRLSAVFPALYHYFLQPVGVSSLFPFFCIQGFHMGNYGMYTYADILVGAFRFPMLLMGLLLLPQSMRMQGNILEKLRMRGFLITCFILAAGIAWADFCLAGMNLRYLLDIMPLLILGSACTILRTTRNPMRTQYRIAVLALVLSIAFLWLMMLTDTGLTLTMQHPNLYETVEDLVIFWQ